MYYDDLCSTPPNSLIVYYTSYYRIRKSKKEPTATLNILAPFALIDLHAKSTKLNTTGTYCTVYKFSPCISTRPICSVAYSYMEYCTATCPKTSCVWTAVWKKGALSLTHRVCSLPYYISLFLTSDLRGSAAGSTMSAL